MQQDNRTTLNDAYKAALDNQLASQRISRQYRSSVARHRYGPDTPLDLYYAPRNEFISVFGLEAYIQDYLRYEVEVDGPKTYIFEDRGDDIFSRGKPVKVKVIPLVRDGGGKMDWCIRIIPRVAAANDNADKDDARAA